LNNKQELVDGKITAEDAATAEGKWPVDRRPEVGHPAGAAEINPTRVIADLRNLMSIAMARRKRRFAREGGGALALSRVKMAFRCLRDIYSTTPHSIEVVLSIISLT